MNMDICKQYVQVRGKPVLARTIQAFENCGKVDEIIVVANENDVSFCKLNIIDKYGFNKVKAIVPGGPLRRDSVWNGLNALDRACGVVLVHDGARPFVDCASITDSIKAAWAFGAACVAVPVKDTVKMADKEEGYVQATLDRDSLWSVQTPQAFKPEILLKAYEKAIEEGFNGADDAVLVERLGYKPKLVYGNYFNIKITTQEDLVIAEAIAGAMDHSF